MPIALQDVPNLTVQTLVRALNQAAILTVDHAVKIDSPEALPANTEVTFTDDELGFVFRGRIVACEELWQGGEGIRYSCADSFRTITKEPAILAESTKLKIRETVSGKTYLTQLLDEFIAGGGPIDSFDISDMEDIQIEPMDMAGQSLFEWLDRILSQTEDTVCWIEYDGGDQPVLKFRKYSDQPALGLQKGDYTVVDPTQDDNPLIVSARIGESLDNKYSKLLLEGCGYFKRWELRYIPPTSWVVDGVLSNVFVYRFDIPEAWATGRYLDADGNCREDMWVRIGTGYTADPPVVGRTSIDLHNIEPKFDEATDQWYFEIKIRAAGLITVPPPVPQIQCWFSYTAFMGPMAEERSGVLSGEGALVFQYPDLFKFEGASGVDYTSVLSGLADRLYERYLTGADRRGNINVHIKGLDPDVQLGAVVTTPAELLSPRVRGIRYDFVRRSMTLDCADTPLRPEIVESQFKARLLTQIQGNWYINHDEAEPSCFCGGPIFVDENENKAANRAGGRGGQPQGPSWDCVWGTCIEQDHGNGQYKTLADCEQNCPVLGWDFIPCTGCVPSDTWGMYDTEADCVADNPDPFDGSFNCGSGSSQSAPASGPEASGKDWTCSGCGCEGSGGDYFLGFIKSIQVDKHGRVIRADCDSCTLHTQSGYTGLLSVLCHATASLFGASVFLDLCYFGMSYSNGILVSVTDTSGSCGQDAGSTNKAVLLAGSECL